MIDPISGPLDLGYDPNGLTNPPHSMNQSVDPEFSPGSVNGVTSQNSLRVPNPGDDTAEGSSAASCVKPRAKWAYQKVITRVRPTSSTTFRLG